MVKKAFLLMVFILLFLSACEEDITDKEDDPTLPVVQTYQLETDNFENFYDVKYHLSYDVEGAYEVTINFDTYFDFEVVDLDVTIYLDVIEVYQDKDRMERYELKLESINNDDHVYKSELISTMTNAYISRFDLSVSSGTVTTTHQLTLESFTYPIRFNNEDNKLIDIQDPIENRKNYEQFMDLFESMDLIESNHMQVRTTQKTRVLQDNQTYAEEIYSHMHMQNDPFYFGFTQNGATTHIEQFEDSEQFIVYETSNEYMHENQYIVHPILVDQHAMISLIEQMGGMNESEISDDFYYDPDKMIFDEIDYGYRVNALLKDFMPEDAYQELVLIYESQGLNPNVLEASQVTMRLTQIDKVYELTISMAFNFLEPIKQTIRSTVIYKIDYSEFTPKHILDDNLLIAPATSMEDVIFETDPLVSNTIHFSPEPHVYKVYLEAGQYVMHIDNDYVLIDVLDQDGFEGNTFIGYQDPSTWDFQDTFFIKNDGYYYFVAHSNYSVDDYTFYAEKLDYEAEIYEPKTLVYGENQIIINERYDLDYFVFDAPKDMFLEVSSEQTTILFFQSKTYKKNYIQNYYLFEFGVGRNWIYVEEGLNYIYFNHPTPIEATIHVKDYGALAHKSSEIAEMTSISDAFLEVPMLLGHQMGKSFLKFDAIKAVYTFSYESSNHILTPGISIYRASDDELIDYVYFDQKDHYNVIMEEGAYYIVIAAGNYVEFNLKATAVPIENQVIDETLGHVSTFDIALDQIPYVEGMLINFYHEPRHRFILDEPSTIVVDTIHYGHKLYDEQGNLLTFNHVNYGFTRTLYFLDAGTYEISPFLKHPYDTFVDYQLPIAIVDTPVIQDTYHIIAPMLYEDMVSPMTFTTNHSYDYEVIKLTVDEATDYYISANKTMYIYDAELKQIGGVSSNVSKFVSFEPGTYYLVSSQYPIGNLRISIYPRSYFE